MITRKPIAPVVEIKPLRPWRRGVFMTLKCKAEFAQHEFETQTFLMRFMERYAGAVSEDDKPHRDKFRREGKHKTGGTCGDMVVFAFKHKVVRCYGCETEILGQPGMLLTLTSGLGKGGSGKRQSLDIATAAKRFGSWFDGN